MNREEVYADITATFGFVPGFVKSIPDSSLDLEWTLMKRIQLEDGPVPQKYRELIGLGIAAVTHCRYCAYFHTTAAKLFGASDEECQAALQYAKTTTGWSTYINGQQIDYEEFCQEIDRIARHVTQMMAQQA
jgi:AhpD family alkylhydroperoxidase